MVSAFGAIALSQGTAIPQAMNRPSAMAMPTERPIRWPAPSNANWKPGLIPVTAAVPTLK